MLHGVIIAGGSGKRLWPKSRKTSPKYLLRLKDNKSLLQLTAARLRRIMPLDNILIITNREHVSIIRRELPAFPRRNIIGEPVSRNTAPAACLAAFIVRKKDPNGVLFIVPADHIIGDEKAIKEIFGLASLIVRIKQALVTIGITPTFASTGFGYVKMGRLYKSLTTDRKYDAYKAGGFTEKPRLKKARAFLKSKSYLWNSGIFIGRAEAFLEEFKRYQPSIYKVASKMEKGLGTKNQAGAINRFYKGFPSISIDYAIMEKTKLTYVVKADIFWQDIGSWGSLEKLLNKDKKGNIIIGDHIGIDVRDSIIAGEKNHLIAAIGLNNTVIMHTSDITLVCPKDRAEDVKGLVELLEKKGLNKYL